MLSRTVEKVAKVWYRVRIRFIVAILFLEGVDVASKVLGDVDWCYKDRQVRVVSSRNSSDGRSAVF